MIGLARANMNTVWIDPIDYQDELAEAVMLLSRRRIKTMVYNHQLCLIDEEIWPWAVRSISDISVSGLTSVGNHFQCSRLTAE